MCELFARSVHASKIICKIFAKRAWTPILNEVVTLLIILKKHVL